MIRTDWNPFDENLPDEVNWSTAKMRLNKPGQRKAVRIPSGFPSLDDVLGGGLCEGLTVTYGMAGAGKSLFAKSIALKFVERKKKVLYFVGEDSYDAPPLCPPLMNSVDMVSYRPGPKKAVQTILKFIKEMKPDLAVIDSLTTILGGTSKAVPEADVREFSGELAARVSGVIPVLGISEIRGSEKYMQPAGGWGVAHAGLQTIVFEKVIINDKWSAQDWRAEFGSIIYWMHIPKDRDGLAQQGRIFRISYLGNEMFLEPVVRRSSDDE